MTLKEYLKSEVAYAQGIMKECDDLEMHSYYEGYRDAMETVLDNVASLNYKVTICLEDLENLEDICYEYHREDNDEGEDE